MRIACCVLERYTRYTYVWGLLQEHVSSAKERSPVLRQLELRCDNVCGMSLPIFGSHGL